MNTTFRDIAALVLIAIVGFVFGSITDLRCGGCGHGGGERDTVIVRDTIRIPPQYFHDTLIVRHKVFTVDTAVVNALVQSHMDSIYAMLEVQRLEIDTTAFYLRVDHNPMVSGWDYELTIKAIDTVVINREITITKYQDVWPISEMVAGAVVIGAAAFLIGQKSK